MNDTNKQTAIRFVEALSNGDADRMADCLAPDAIAITKGFSKLSGVAGRDKLLGKVRSLRQFFPQGLGLRIVSVVGDGDIVALELEGDGRTRDGIPYHNQYAMVLTFKDGLIVQSNEYFCTRHAEEVLLRAAVHAELPPATDQH